MESTSNTARQLVLLCDGTNNNLTGRETDTHVVLLAEILREHVDAQRVVYYDPGVGNSGQLPGTTVVQSFNRKSERIGGLAFGGGVFDNIAEGYIFLMRHWQPGDEIFLFGFSRGAFTARSIGGLVNAFGILEPQLETLVPTLVAAYFSDDSEERKAISEQIERLFTQQRRPNVHFVGVWDTVASVGLPPFALQMRTTPTLTGKRFLHVRHALALDEHRAQFKARAYAEDNGPITLKGGEQGSLQQFWFRGSHCDVGGGYHFEASAQARAPFAWMIAEAAKCGLRLPGAVQPLDEPAVLKMVAARDPLGHEPPHPHLNSETWATPVWAITGLAVRDTRRPAVDGKAGEEVAMAVHPSVEEGKYSFPLSTVWTGHWTWRQWACITGALLLGMFMALVVGHALGGKGGWTIMMLGQACAFLEANLHLQAWQLNLLEPRNDWLETLHGFSPSFGAVAKAVLWDFLFIGAWGTVLAHAVTPAFAFWSGLVQFREDVPRLLNRLGWMLPLALLADVTENILTLLLLGITAPDWTWAFLVLRFFVFLASLAKWVFLLGVLVLMAGGFINWVRSRPWQRLGNKAAGKR